jgi:hypothetical protein
VSFDPFRPDDAGDFSATFAPRHAAARRSPVVRVLVAAASLAFLAAAAVVAVAVV